MMMVGMMVVDDPRLPGQILDVASDSMTVRSFCTWELDGICIATRSLGDTGASLFKAVIPLRGLSFSGLREYSWKVRT
jgi:hypothetical protein